MTEVHGHQLFELVLDFDRYRGVAVTRRIDKHSMTLFAFPKIPCLLAIEKVKRLGLAAFLARLRYLNLLV